MAPTITSLFWALLVLVLAVQKVVGDIVINNQ
jgi:hypothetical protein